MRIYTKVVLDWEGHVLESESYEYDGPVALACGPSQQQKDLATAQINMYNTESDIAKQQYAQTQKIQDEVQAQWLPIFNKGPYQNFFAENPAEWNDIMSQITTSEGQATKNALQATMANLNAAGGGNEFIPQGATEAIKAAINTSGAQATAGAQTQAKLQGYTMGANLFQQAGAALAGVPSFASTEGSLLGAANQGGEAAEKTQYDIAQESMAPFSVLGSALGTIGGGLMTGGIGAGIGKKIGG